uniref:DUF4283 domain-containing protein n=1 Tax=Cannabis sativa TaxID=3483 RepID=A0A803QH09_CANSA
MASSSHTLPPPSTFTDEGSLIHNFDHISLNSNESRNTLCLVFKILSNKSLKPAWIEKAMHEAWTLRFRIEISDYLPGLFLVSFQCEGDRRRVLQDQPWRFDKSLFIFTNPEGIHTLLPDHLRFVPFWIQANNIPFGWKSLQLAHFISCELGELIETYPLSLLESFGPSLCLRILLHTTKPLRRAMNIHFRSSPRPKWISFQYEGLQNFCYFCGLMDHTYNKCGKYLLRCDNLPFPPELGYKDILRAPSRNSFKNNPFDLSNSVPIEEYYPPASNTDQTLQYVVDQFLNIERPVSFPARCSENLPTQPVSSAQTAVPNHHNLISTPIPIMVTSVITHADKGKGIALGTTTTPTVIHPPTLEVYPSMNHGLWVPNVLLLVNQLKLRWALLCNPADTHESPLLECPGFRESPCIP